MTLTSVGPTGYDSCMDAENISRASLLELVTALRERKLSPIELAQHTLARMDATQDTLNAVIARCDPDLVMPSRSLRPF